MSLLYGQLYHHPSTLEPLNWGVGRCKTAKHHVIANFLRNVRCGPKKLRFFLLKMAITACHNVVALI